MARSKSTTTRSRKQAPPPPITWDEKLISGIVPYRVELAGTLMLLVAVVTVLAMLDLTRSNWLSWWTSLLDQTFGWGIYALCFLLAALGIHMILRKVDKPYTVRPAQVIGFELILLTALALSSQISSSTLQDAYAGRGGGLVGWALAQPLLDFLGPFLTIALYAFLLLWGLALLSGLRWHDGQRALQWSSGQLASLAADLAPPQRRPKPAARTTAMPPPAPPPQPAAAVEPSTLPPPRRRSRRLPPLAILERGTQISSDEAEVAAKKETIEQALADFGIPAEVTQIRRGPAVTQFGVLPGYIERSGPDGDVRMHKVRIGQIASLRSDLALALAAPRLRIQAPIPGRGVVGVEVPNEEVFIVRLRDIVESAEFAQTKAPLAIGLGRDVSGTPHAVDLGKLPHLLIAGTTGSGKSV